MKPGEPLKPDIPTILVVFGATGDLVRRKLLPALFHLHESKLLPELFSVVGFSRRDLTGPQYQDLVMKALSEHVPADAGFTDFPAIFTYHRGNFDEPRDYLGLAEVLRQTDSAWEVCANKLFYLAVPPEHDEGILRNIAASGLTKPCAPEEGWTRVLVEKPFGKNLKQAENIDSMLGQLFKEEQVYRIDHYLAKELLQNILAFRFSNNLLEEVWNKNFIEKIELRLLEDIGIEGRGPYYDGIGALLDVGQNHLLQMLALITMDDPIDFRPETIRDRRTEALQHVRIPDLEDVKTGSVRAQYQGYLDEPGVKPDSRTETYFRLRTSLSSPRWEGVPIFLEAGKMAGSVDKRITVSFRHPVHCLCPVGGKKHYKNHIDFRLQPNPGIGIQFWSKKPGSTMELEEQLLEFSYKGLESEPILTEEYAKVLMDCIAGDQTLFICSEEALTGWRFIDPVVSAWHNEAVPLHTYSNERSPSEIGKTIDRPLMAGETIQRSIGVIGLGRMGGNIARHLIGEGWDVVGYNRTPAVTKQLEAEGLQGVASLEEMIGKLAPPRVMWLMVPAGQVVDDMVFGENGLAQLLSKGDIVIDAGNSFYKDTIRRARQADEMGFTFTDVGVSGGPKGAHWGACLMVGGKRATYEYLLPLFVALSVSQGVRFYEGIGAGHFVKMVHNGIEYGMMQAIAEGFNVLRHSEYDLDLTQVADLYNHGSVIESRLMEWLRQAYERSGDALTDVSGTVGHSGEGAWTVATAKEMGLKAENIEQSLNFRIRSVEEPDYVGKVLTALREQFGEHGLGS